MGVGERIGSRLQHVKPIFLDLNDMEGLGATLHGESKSATHVVWIRILTNLEDNLAKHVTVPASLINREEHLIFRTPRLLDPDKLGG